MSEALINRLVEFAESGNQQKIVLTGQVHQGWVMEITEDALLISTGYSDKSVKTTGFPFTICNRQNYITGITKTTNGQLFSFKSFPFISIQLSIQQGA